jgi:hypothetical protein
MMKLVILFFFRLYFNRGRKFEKKVKK